VKNDRSGEVAVTDWVHNAWGGKYPPYDLDNKIPPSIATKLEACGRFENDMILEGGSIDVNGQGLLLTSEQCLLNKNRNPHLFREEIERNLQDYLGVTKVLWVGEGIVGDDTDGHIDDITRFYKPDGFVTVVEPNRRDPNHKLLEEVLERLRGFRTPGGQKVRHREAADAEAVRLPRPAGAGELREFSHHQRRGARAAIPPEATRRRGVRDHRAIVSPAGRSSRSIATT
jgi:agmatine deiminase